MSCIEPPPQNSMHIHNLSRLHTTVTQLHCFMPLVQQDLILDLSSAYVTDTLGHAMTPLQSIFNKFFNFISGDTNDFSTVFAVFTSLNYQSRIILASVYDCPLLVNHHSRLSCILSSALLVLLCPVPDYFVSDIIPLHYC